MPNPHEGRPPHPRYGAPLGGRPVTIDGVVFRPYRHSIAMTVRCSDDFRITIWTNRNGRAWTYSTLVDGTWLPGKDPRRPKVFRSDRAAAEAGVAELHRRQGATA